MEFVIVLLDGGTLFITFVNREVKGQELLHNTFNHCQLSADSKYFGLLQSDSMDGGMNWLEPTDSFRKRKRYTLQLGVKFYPKHPDIVLREEPARYLLRCQIKQDLLSGKLACGLATHAFLDSLVMQGEAGDLDPETANTFNVLRTTDKLDVVPPSHLNCTECVSEPRYLKMVLKRHKDHRGLCRSDADRMFLSQMRFVPWYGCIAYPLATQEGANRGCPFIGLSDNGITMLRSVSINRAVQPEVTESYAWNELAYCESKGHLLLLGVYGADGAIQEQTFKVSKARSSLKTNEATRIAKHVMAYKDALSSGLPAFYGSRKLARKTINSARLPREQSGTRRIRRRLSSLTLTLRKHSARKTLEISPSPSAT